MDAGLNLASSNMRDVLDSVLFTQLANAGNSLPAACSGCPWSTVCCGGQMTHRFSKSNGFDNRSVYCEGLQMLYRHASVYLLRNGMKIQSLDNVLSTALKNRPVEVNHNELFSVLP